MKQEKLARDICRHKNKHIYCFEDRQFLCEDCADSTRCLHQNIIKIKILLSNPLDVYSDKNYSQAKKSIMHQGAEYLKKEGVSMTQEEVKKFSERILERLDETQDEVGNSLRDALSACMKNIKQTHMGHEVENMNEVAHTVQKLEHILRKYDDCRNHLVSANVFDKLQRATPDEIEAEVRAMLKEVAHRKSQPDNCNKPAGYSFTTSEIHVTDEGDPSELRNTRKRGYFPYRRSANMKSLMVFTTIAVVVISIIFMMPCNREQPTTTVIGAMQSVSTNASGSDLVKNTKPNLANHSEGKVAIPATETKLQEGQKATTKLLETPKQVTSKTQPKTVPNQIDENKHTYPGTSLYDSITADNLHSKVMEIYKSSHVANPAITIILNIFTLPQKDCVVYDKKGLHFLIHSNKISGSDYSGEIDSQTWLPKGRGIRILEDGTLIVGCFRKEHATNNAIGIYPNGTIVDIQPYERRGDNFVEVRLSTSEQVKDEDAAGRKQESQVFKGSIKWANNNQYTGDLTIVNKTKSNQHENGYKWVPHGDGELFFSSRKGFEEFRNDESMIDSTITLANAQRKLAGKWVNGKLVHVSSDRQERRGYSKQEHSSHKRGGKKFKWTAASSNHDDPEEL